jgi:hypothetical protein
MTVAPIKTTTLIIGTWDARTDSLGTNTWRAAPLPDASATVRFMSDRDAPWAG